MQGLMDSNSDGRQPSNRWIRTISAKTFGKCFIVALIVASSTGLTFGLSGEEHRPAFNGGTHFKV
jgi:hypothetical protein